MADKNIKDIKYSVLMSVYAKDNSEYLKESIDSMLCQTIPAEQFVLVIDGPISKELETVVCTYEKQEKIFTVCRLKQNKGLGNALNIGLKHCRNELVARMDADDISLPTRCEEELKCFCKKSDLVICGCNIDEFYQNPSNIKTSRIVPFKYREIKAFMRKRQAFNHPTVIYKKSKVLEAGGYIPLKRKEDFDLFSRMISKGYYAENVNKSLYLYRANEENYGRRRSWDNLKSAVYVYWRHLKRKGCSIIDFFVVCCSEIIFFIVPHTVMKWLSDTFLRTKVEHKNKKREAK